MDFTDETEDTLLGYMAMQGDDPNAARAAWQELYTRHHPYFITVLGRAHGNDLGGRDGVVDLMIEAFQQLYEWAGRQPDPDAVVAKFTGANRDSTRKKVLAYITRIAKNLFMDRLRGVERSPVLTDLDDDTWQSEWQRRSQNPVPRPTREVLDLYDHALCLLSEREAEVLRLSLPWYDPDAGNFNFPAGEAERVAESIGTTPENFRQIRSRSIRRVRAALEREGLASTTKGDSR